MDGGHYAPLNSLLTTGGRGRVVLERVDWEEIGARVISSVIHLTIQLRVYS